MYLRLEGNKIAGASDMYHPEEGYITEVETSVHFMELIGKTYDPIKKEVIAQEVKLAPLDKSNIETYGNIWVREVIFEKKGEVKEAHKHTFDHLHFLAKGSAKITIKDPKSGQVYSMERTAPAWLKVPKEFPHQVEALEDDTAGYCIEALYSDKNEILSSDMIFDADDWEKEQDVQNVQNVIDFNPEQSSECPNGCEDIKTKTSFTDGSKIKGK